MSDPQLKTIMERILRLHAEEEEIKADRREVYAEAKANGYDKTALGAAIAAIRKRERLGENVVAERETIADLYLAAYDAPRAHTHAHEAETPSGADTGSDVRAVAPIANRTLVEA